ncbi:YHS domain-containing protein, partial [Mycobacterium tuberculosis]|nr:YHS domain-containing protein [Mycobacterium tuberculosis]
PVTGNKVETAHAVTANFEGKTYFFESESSRTVFQQDPAKYVHQHHRHHGCC